MIYARPKIRVAKPTSLDMDTSYIRQARRFGYSDKEIAEKLTKRARILITEMDITKARKSIGVK